MERSKVRKFKPSTKYITVMRSAEPTCYQRPGPTVPHLKYGLFPKGITNRSIPTPDVDPRMKKNPIHQPGETNLRRNVPKKLKNIPTPQSSYISEPVRNKKIEKKTLDITPKYQEDREPVLVFRPIDHRDFRRLTISASTHLDIKPKGFLRSIQSDPPRR